MAAVDTPKVRILVVGDSGVGKTSLVHLLCHNETIDNPDWTIGCSVEVKLHDYKVGQPGEKTYFVELWDVGGWASHAQGRSVFYNQVNGILLVHDLTNRKSELNLRKWLIEVLNKDSKELPEDPEQLVNLHIPVLVVGTKSDMVKAVHSSSTLPTWVNKNRTTTVAEECGLEQINIDCTQVKHLAAGTSNSVRFSRFFDKVIESRFYAGPSRDCTGKNMYPVQPSYSPVERRRGYQGYNHSYPE